MACFWAFTALAESKNSLNRAVADDERWLSCSRRILDRLDARKPYSEDLDICFGTYFWSSKVQFSTTAYEQVKSRGLDLISNKALMKEISRSARAAPESTAAAGREAGTTGARTDGGPPGTAPSTSRSPRADASAVLFSRPRSITRASAAGKRFGAIVETLGATPALYWDVDGQRWAAGTNALATKLQETGPPTGSRKMQYRGACRG